MKLEKIFAPLFAVTMFGGATACDVDKTDEGELPEVQYKGGDMPNYDVETRDVDAPDVDMPDVDMPDVDAPDVDAPDIDVETEERTIEVPDVDVNSDDEQR